MRITKTQIREFVKAKLATDKRWAIQALLRIYEYQTVAEQRTGETRELNGVGFSGADGEILSSFVRFYEKKNYLSPKQMTILFKKIIKYHKQIIKISDEKVLIRLVAASLMTDDEGEQ